MIEIRSQPAYYVLFFTTKFRSIDEIKAKAPEALGAHLSRSNELHKRAKVLMAGAFSNNPGEPIKTMAIFYSREDAEEYAKGDPFLIIGMVTEWHIEQWANILREQS
jgi:uncharacterized protein YciI